MEQIVMQEQVVELLPGAGGNNPLQIFKSDEGSDNSEFGWGFQELHNSLSFCFNRSITYQKISSKSLKIIIRPKRLILTNVLLKMTPIQYNNTFFIESISQYLRRYSVLQVSDIFGLISDD